MDREELIKLAYELGYYDGLEKTAWPGWLNPFNWFKGLSGSSKATRRVRSNRTTRQVSQATEQAAHSAGQAAQQASKQGKSTLDWWTKEAYPELKQVHQKLIETAPDHIKPIIEHFPKALGGLALTGAGLGVGFHLGKKVNQLSMFQRALPYAVGAAGGFIGAKLLSSKD